MQMQHFIDSVSGQLYAFDEDVEAVEGEDGYELRTASGDKLDVPVTLVPHEPAAPSQDEIDASAAVAARAKRGETIAATDWTQLPNVPEATREKYVPYRQALRDLPEQPGFPHTVVWPDLP